MLKGLDASSVQGALPYTRLVEMDIRFVILKAQQGNDGFDPWFERNMKDAIDHGIEPFAYCFFYPLPVTKPTRDPRYQAELFVDSVHRFPEMRGRPIFIDEEWPEVENWPKWGCSAPQINNAMRVNADAVHELSGARPALYTYLWWWNAVSAGADTAWAADYDLWMAWYLKGQLPGPGQKPKVPAPWTHARWWQFDGNGGLLLPNGVDADFCVFDGTEEELRRIARGVGDSDPTVRVEVPSRRPPQIGDFGILRPLVVEQYSKVDDHLSRSDAIVRGPVPLGRPSLDGDLPTTPPDDDDEPPAAA